ncbi:hypothetical protein TRICI_005372 [Trichomonascus ciferrii]|uniref:Zn(2)-C6 fungal-type domain-containing protein n=1 Tax=Trichomonascus ciferrii TaxID=44093 RepID=A0A642UY00_9ASCO|nr:hypothetical protein TRICI_005372 [Trichomonascus ciferrii]
MSSFGGPLGTLNFADNWRRRRACQRCRKIKVRCEYDSPGSLTCKRCTKAGVECVVEHEKEHGPGRVPEEIANNGFCNQTAAQENARLARVKELENTITSAKLELSALKGLEPTEQTGSLDGVGVGTKTTQEENVVKGAIEQGLITESDARRYFEMALENSVFLYVPFGSSIVRDFDRCCEEQSLVALAIILGIAGFNTLEGVAELRNYFDSAFAERTFVQASLSVDTIRALLIIGLFVQAWPPIKVSFYLTTAISVATTLTLGDEKDITDIHNSPVGSEEWDTARQRLQILMSLHLCTIAISINADNSQFLSMLPVSSTCYDALHMHGYREDKLLVQTVKMLLAGKASIESMTKFDSYKQNSSTIKRMLDNEKKNLSEMVDSTTYLLTPEERQKTDCWAMTPFLAFDSQMRLALNEAALNKLIFRDDGEPEDRCIVLNVANEIISIGRFMIDGFVNLTSKNVMVPKYVYVRSAQAVVALARIAMILRGLNEEVPPEITTEIDRVLLIWGNGSKVSYSMQNMNFVYQKIERILKLRQLKNVEGKLFKPESTAKSMSEVIKDVIRKVQVPRGLTQKRKRRRVEDEYWNTSYDFNYSKAISRDTKQQPNDFIGVKEEPGILDPPPLMQDSGSEFVDSSGTSTKSDSPLDQDTMNKLLSELFSEIGGVEDV